jgi:hypothetical protein
MLEEGGNLIRLSAMLAVNASKQAVVTKRVASDREHSEVRWDLQSVLDREQYTFDAARPEVMPKRHALGMQSARENIQRLSDAGSFVE